MSLPARLTVLPLGGIPEVPAGANLAGLLLAAVAEAGERLAEGDIVAVSSKVASKALGLTVPVDERPKAEVVARESVAVVAERQAGAHVTRVVRSIAGPVMVAAGVDASNTGGADVLLLLPHDPDEVCRTLRHALCLASGVTRLGVVLTDTAGRPWRAGQTDYALGSAGLRVLDDLRGTVDADGRPLEVTARAVADEIAAAADLVKGKATGVPAVLVRGLAPSTIDSADDERRCGARDLVRSGPGDWFAMGSQEAVRAALGVAPGSPRSEAVGIRPAGADTVAAQVSRAVGVALATGLDAGIDVGPDRIEVSAAEPVVLGAVAARLSAALAGEGVAHDLALTDPAIVTLAQS